MKKIKVNVEKTKTGFSAYTPQFPGVVSTGKTWNEVHHNFSEAFDFHIQGMIEDQENVPQNFSLEFCLDLQQFFEHYKVFNVSALAEYLKLNTQLLHQYKDGHKVASEKTSLKIIKGLDKFGKELLSNS